MADRPSGTVTFLFTDIEGSTDHWEQRPQAMPASLAACDGILRRAIEQAGGAVFATGGDGLAAAFARADAAVAAAVEAQRCLAAVDWPDGLALKVRMALHTGEGHERGGDYFGPAVTRAARLTEAANGAQIYLSAATREVVGHDLGPAMALVDLGAHELRDVVEPMRLYRLESDAFESDRRPPRTGTVRTGNLPVSPGLLLGRDEEVEAILADLATARIVTLTGAGGIGKTSLALEVGRRLQPTQRDGVWLAPLDTIDRPEAVAGILLGLLGIDPGTGAELDALLSGLRVRDTVLILDNCEHVLDGAARVAAAVRESCPSVQVVATSREPLDVPGERIRRVPSLGTDGHGPALALFRLRAEAAGAVFDPVADQDIIGRICRRLDGIPLAIELAASRATSLRPATIADRLDDMFGLLRAGRRAGIERHRTLRAALDWSHDLLQPAEQVLLARLSVFAGSFALDAAEAVGAGGPTGPGDTLDLLDRLVARSLVVPVDEGSESRFRLLEPIRQLAAEKLVASAEAEAVREAHAQWYLDLIVHLDDRWRNGDDQGTWPIAAQELSNLRVAFDRLLETGRVDDAQRFAVAAFGPIAVHSGTVPIYDWAPRAALAAPSHIGPATGSVRALAAWGAMPRGDLDGAATWLGQAAEAIERGSRDDGFVVAAAMHLVRFGGRQALSDEFLQRSVSEAMESGDLHRRIWVQIFIVRPVEAVADALRLGHTMLLGTARFMLARQVLTGPSDPEAQWEALESLWETAQRCHSYLILNSAAHWLGAAHIRRGAPVDGLLLLRAPARDWLMRTDSRVWDVVHTIATGLASAGDLSTAARLVGAIGGRHLGMVLDDERCQLRSAVEAGLQPEDRARHARAGRQLDAADAVAEALGRIEALAAPTAAADTASLTPRQLEVTALVARGLTNKQIAHRLGISRFTAETHVRNILGQLGAASRSEIATWAARSVS